MHLAVPSARNKLREYLLNVLLYLENGPPSHEGLALESLLSEAVEGLDALNLGEIPAIFAPAKVKERWLKPATIRYFKLRALGYVALLRELGRSPESAIAEVADAYNVSEDTIRKWKKTLDKDRSPETMRIKREPRLVYLSAKKLNWPVSEQGLFTKMQRDGLELKKAKITKRPQAKTIGKK